MRLSASVLNRGMIRAIGLSPYVLGSKGNYTAREQRFENLVNKQEHFGRPQWMLA